MHEERTNKTNNNDNNDNDNNNNNNNNNDDDDDDDDDHQPYQHLWRRPTAAPFFVSRASRCVVSWLCRKVLFRVETWPKKGFLSLLAFTCVRAIALLQKMAFVWAAAARPPVAFLPVPLGRRPSPKFFLPSPVRSPKKQNQFAVPVLFPLLCGLWLHVLALDSRSLVKRKVDRI